MHNKGGLSFRESPITHQTHWLQQFTWVTLSDSVSSCIFCPTIGYKIHIDECLEVNTSVRTDGELTGVVWTSKQPWRLTVALTYFNTRCIEKIDDMVHRVNTNKPLLTFSWHQCNSNGGQLDIGTAGCTVSCRRQHLELMDENLNQVRHPTSKPFLLVSLILSLLSHSAENYF